MYCAGFDDCFSLHAETGIGYCNNIVKLFEAFDHTHNPKEWRLFIDSSISSFKGVLLHNGNNYPSVPIVYGASAKENYDTIKLVLNLIKYDEFRWKICSDLKVVAILTGLKEGFPKHQCFYCLWEGRRTELHYTKYQWEYFPILTPAKIQSAYFNGKQIDQLFKTDAFRNLLTVDERRAFDAIHRVMQNFLGNRRSEDYQRMVKFMIASFRLINVRMSLKIHFLGSHLDHFPKNCGDCSDEQGERFHQDIKEIEKDFKGKDICHMMATHCWKQCRSKNPSDHKRKITQPFFFLNLSQ